MKFIYRARDKAGNIKTGKIEARSVEAAVSTLQSYGMIVLEVAPETKKSFFDQFLGAKAKIKLINIHINEGPIVTISGQKNYIYEKEYTTYIENINQRLHQDREI